MLTGRRVLKRSTLNYFYYHFIADAFLASYSTYISNHKRCEAIQCSLDPRALLKTLDRYRLFSTEKHCLAWNKHVASIQSRVYPKLKLLNRISSFLSRHILLRIDKQTLLLFLDYGCVLAVNAERRMPNA